MTVNLDSLPWGNGKGQGKTKIALSSIFSP
jgi:hypothetical protein